MTYKIPKADILALAIKETLRQQRTVISQAKLTALVNTQLKRLDPEYTASEERIRRIALGAKLARVEIQTRELEDRTRAASCPVCGRKRMRRIRNRTIFDGKVTLGYKCRACGYKTGLKRSVPVRYTFNAEDFEPAYVEQARSDPSQTKL
jgi:DNA-directed RNA polymerase subunit M/transcription elongation factor TFIIS